MRKKNRNIWKKNIKYNILWMILVILLILGTIFSYQAKLRGIFQDIAVETLGIFGERKITLTEYDQKLISSLRSENETLRNLLEYKKSLVDYKIIPSSIIFRESYLKDTIIIDRGKKDGVTKNMAVVSEKGLIGLVEEVYQDSSLIRLLTDTIKPTRVSIACKSGEEELYGVLDSYDKLTDTFQVTMTDKKTDIEIGSEVLTSGLGGVFPRGILLGTVSNITTDELEISVVLKVKSEVNFKEIGYVFILEK